MNKNEIYGLLGPNGSGKTTAIKILCGLLKSTGGEASVLGIKVPNRKIYPRIGYMPQDVAVYMNLTVHDNLVLFGELNSIPRDELERREKELLEFVELDKWKNALTADLSGGMRHRLSLICSMIHEPELLFLDEPTIGVDPELRASFWVYFNRLKEKGTTILITTHYMDEAGHCDRVGLLRKGKLIAEGAPKQIVESAGVSSLEEAFLKISGGKRS